MIFYNSNTNNIFMKMLKVHVHWLPQGGGARVDTRPPPGFFFSIWGLHMTWSYVRIAMIVLGLLLFISLHGCFLL